MIFPEWAREEEQKIVEEYIKIPDDEKGDLFEYVESHSSKELTEVREQCRREKEEALKNGCILN